MREPPRAADRAISELIGMVLLIALVLLGSTTIVVLGAGALSDAQEQTQTEAAEDHLQQFDSELSTLAASDGLPRAEFDGELAAYRADSGTVVLADSERAAHKRVRELTGAEAPTVERLE